MALVSVLGWWRVIRFPRVAFAVAFCLLVLGALLLVSLIWSVLAPFGRLSRCVVVAFFLGGFLFCFGCEGVGSVIFCAALVFVGWVFGVCFVCVGLALVGGGLIGAVSGFVCGVFGLIVFWLVSLLRAFCSLFLWLLFVVRSGGWLAEVVVVVVFVGIALFLWLARGYVFCRSAVVSADSAWVLGGCVVVFFLRGLVAILFSPVISFSAVASACLWIFFSMVGFFGVGLVPGSSEWGFLIACGRPAVSLWWMWFLAWVGLILFGCALYFVGVGVIGWSRRSWGSGPGLSRFSCVASAGCSGSVRGRMSRSLVASCSLWVVAGCWAFSWVPALGCHFFRFAWLACAPAASGAVVSCLWWTV
ncbi:hypothetical protein [Arthrobacter sp. cf158]|uniref:hypothetical protein n=1 Tax=Arthrobacter sp. cf158 TaxID=1761744 RepID=UPI00111477C0|nr:hypothetical protein [Arthrobacter sp. cf158]